MPVTWASADSWRESSSSTVAVSPVLVLIAGNRPRSRGAAARLCLCACHIVEELQQDVLGKLKPERPRSANIGDRLDFPARQAAGLAEGRFGKGSSRQKRFGSRQSRHLRPDAAISDCCRLDFIAFQADPDARAKRGDVHVFALGYLVKLHDFAGRGQRDQDAGDELVRFDDGLLRPGVKCNHRHAASAAGARAIRAPRRRSRGNRASRPRASRGRYCPPAWPRCGFAARRTAR